MNERKSWHFFRAGRVERGPKYDWRDGYCRIAPGSDGGNLCETFPWLTKREAQSFAKEHGGKAVFHEREDEARSAVSADEAARVDTGKAVQS